MVCLNCNSTSLKSLSLIHASGSYELRGRVQGFLLGTADGLYFGKHRGQSQTNLSKIAGPPCKAPYLRPVGLWLLGLFIVMAFAGRGRISMTVAVFDLAYILLLPALLVTALKYNLFVRPGKIRACEGKFMCQRYGMTL
jgi:hypothetical protein